MNSGGEKLTADHYFEAKLREYCQLYIEFLGRKCADELRDNPEGKLAQARKKLLIDLLNGQKAQNKGLGNDLLRINVISDDSGRYIEYYYVIEKIPARYYELKLPNPFYSALDKKMRFLHQCLIIYFNDVFCPRTNFRHNLMAFLAECRAIGLNIKPPTLPIPGNENYIYGIGLDPDLPVKLFCTVNIVKTLGIDN